MEDALSRWTAPGLDVTLDYPTDTNPKYRASVKEFDLSAEGDTLEEAYEAVISLVVRMAVVRILHGEPLPDRAPWREARDSTLDGGDG